MKQDSQPPKETKPAPDQQLGMDKAARRKQSGEKLIAFGEKMSRFGSAMTKFGQSYTRGCFTLIALGLIAFVLYLLYN